MIDFETAIEFAPDALLEKKLCNELSAPAHLYVRKRPNELTHDPLIYCSFRLDIWQFGHDLVNHFAVRSCSHSPSFY